MKLRQLKQKVKRKVKMKLKNKLKHNTTPQTNHKETQTILRKIYIKMLHAENKIKTHINQNIQWTKHPPEKNDENYPTIPNSNNIRKQENPTEQKQKSETKEPTIISETQIIPEAQTNNSPKHTSNNDTQQPGISNTPTSAQKKIINTQIITSPTLVNNRFRVLQETPDQEDINTPDTTPTNNETDNEILTPTSPTPKSKRQKRPEARLYKAKKFTTQLQAVDFCDTGNLNNATKQEKTNIIALTICSRHGVYDRSNEFIKNYKHKDILDKYKQITEKRPTKSNTLLELYDILQNIEIRIEPIKIIQHKHP